MTPHIQTPVEKFTGNVVGVDFKEGVGHAEDVAQISYFERHAYGVAPSCPPDCEHVEQAPGGGKEPSPKEKLQAEAKALGLDETGTKAELEARIAEHKATAEKQPAVPETPPAGDNGKPDDGKGGE